MATQIQLRRGTASAWTSANPTLAQGELGLESDTGKFKVGNGTSTWTSLPYSSGVQGPQGSTGPQGFQGVTGAASTVQGPQGFQGPQGTQGNQGAVGATGNVGPQGSTGFQGYQGSQGSQGAVGAQGAQGYQGVQGAVGSQGSQGSQGVQGSVGLQGPQGNQGFQGPQGNQGSQGAQGAASTVAGPQGSQGAAGAQGAAGSNGAQGAAGSQGPQGAQGSTTVGTAIDITAASTTTVPLIVRSISGQSSRLSQWINASGNVVVFITHGNANGQVAVQDPNTNQQASLYADSGGAFARFGTPSTPDGYAKMGAFNSAFTIEAFNLPTRYVRSGSDGVVMQVRGYSTQTNNLQEWQNSSGTVLAQVTSSGEMRAALIDGGSA